jgi:hypothetical protein
MPESFRELSDQFKDSGFRKIPADSLKMFDASNSSNLLMNLPESFIAGKRREFISDLQ